LTAISQPPLPCFHPLAYLRQGGCFLISHRRFRVSTRWPIHGKAVASLSPSRRFRVSTQRHRFLNDIGRHPELGSIPTLFAISRQTDMQQKT